MLKFSLGLALIVAVSCSPVIDVAKSLDAFEPVLPKITAITEELPVEKAEKKGINEEDINWSYCP